PTCWCTRGTSRAPSGPSTLSTRSCARSRTRARPRTAMPSVDRACSATRCRCPTTPPCSTGCSACSAATPTGGLRPPEPAPARGPARGRGLAQSRRHDVVLPGGRGQPLGVVEPAGPAARAHHGEPALVAHRPHRRPVDEVVTRHERGYASSPRGGGPYPDRSLRPPGAPITVLRTTPAYEPATVAGLAGSLLDNLARVVRGKD